MRGKRSIKKFMCAVAFISLFVSLCGCGDKDEKESNIASKISEATGTNTEETDNGGGKKSDGAEAIADMADQIAQAVDENVDEKWIEVLEENGTFYDALYSLPKIMKEDPGDHPVDIKIPDGIIKENLDYYIPQMQQDDGDDEGEVPAMSDIIGRWLPVTAKYEDIETDYTWAREAGVDMHLELNEDGTSSCNMYDGEQKDSWDEKIIKLNGMECEYRMVGDNLVLSRDMGLDTKMSWTFERDNKNNSFVRAHEDQVTGFNGHRLSKGKLYRLARTYEGKDKKDASVDDPELSPEDHFVVLVETDEDAHNGFGYMRSGITDTALYYQSDRGIVKLINENTGDRSGGQGRTKFEMEDDDKLLRLWPGYMGNPNKYYEYELCEDEPAPISHLAVGPTPDRNFEIPEGTHEKAGVWRLDRIYSYTYLANDPLMQGEYRDVDDTVYGEKTRKYDADIWYVLRKDGTGYMRVWNKYFEVVWSDDEQYYYDISGRHKLGTVVGEIDYDALFTRLFKDELNPEPEYPDELKDK